VALVAGLVAVEGLRQVLEVALSPCWGLGSERREHFPR
jgi:hypothetical protein